MIIARGQTSSSPPPPPPAAFPAFSRSLRASSPPARSSFNLLLSLPLLLPSPLPRSPYARVIITAAIRHASLATLCPGEASLAAARQSRAIPRQSRRDDEIPPGVIAGISLAIAVFSRAPGEKKIVGDALSFDPRVFRSRKPREFPKHG